MYPQQALRLLQGEYIESNMLQYTSCCLRKLLTVSSFFKIADFTLLKEERTTVIVDESRNVIKTPDRQV